MIANLPDPLGLPQARHGRQPRFVTFRRAAQRLHVLTSWHGLSRIIRDPLWKVGTASLLSVPLLAGIYQAGTGGAVAVEPSRFPPQSAALFIAGLAAAAAIVLYRVFCPAVIKEQLRPADYAGYRPHVVNALRTDVVQAFDQLMLQIVLGPEDAKHERLRGRVMEAELVEGLMAQGFKPVRYGYGCREMYAVQELAMRVGNAAGVPVWVRYGREEIHRPVTPDLWMLPAWGTDLYHLELSLRGPGEDGDTGEGVFLHWVEGRTDVLQDHRFSRLRERRTVAMMGVEQLVTPRTVVAVREGITDWLTLTRPNARAAIVGLLTLAVWQIAFAVFTQLTLVRGIIL
ncbi:hypothetical protein [Longimicrobium sp.]|uniref:hypothetical protein n=1 Tax=Longimicrobium sp. TaxID=2029185 RepID=UPI002E3268EC|nr:hypothetical protein [Longimicrobium sp.]HEX6039466.1 hypothetical protein [Longimicrobium sp.]